MSESNNSIAKKQRIFKPGDIIEFKIKIEEGSLPISFVLLNFINPSKSKIYDVEMFYSDDEKQWIGRYKVQEVDEKGVYNKFSIIIVDKAKNNISGWNLLDDFKDDLIFEIDNDKENVRLPKILDVAVVKGEA